MKEIIIPKPRNKYKTNWLLLLPDKMKYLAVEQTKKNAPAIYQVKLYHASFTKLYFLKSAHKVFITIG